MNRVCQILKIQKPVIQAPLFWMTSPKLVAAVSNAGGLGVLGINGGFKKPVSTYEETISEMRKSIRETKKLTNKPFALNVFPAKADFFGFSKGIIQICKEEGVKTLVLVGETSEEEIAKLKEDGFTLITRELNPTVRGAQKAEKAGADIVVATGCDEGGLMPYLSSGTFSQVALISEAVKVPVLAAGGIVNEKMAKASAIVGAEGAFVGTRFILSEENPTAQVVKEDLLKTHPDEYIVFSVMNGFAKSRVPPHKIGKECILANKNGNLNPKTGSPYDGIIKGDLDAAAISVSNLTPLIKSIDPCKKIVEEIARGYL
ncbi:hypothetical protein PIROE2DRAFT_42850 [Piromyces sp. E2]|nr:hypothetical protein PIROE2DRAFT_42850 [Piromyces sp. E2]|eukprot:OUM64154.1 hypothetical protein PIROE2DRAFT_42850 [Piromyces sp. E2]